MTAARRMPYTVRVPASTSNLGAGFDCLGLALDLWLEARLVEGSGPARLQGTLEGLDESADIMSAILRQCGVSGGWHIEARSAIPVGKGLGSSAAARVAGVALAQLARGDMLDRDAVFRHAAAAEGHPDNAGPAVYGGLFLASSPPARLTPHASLGIALAVPDAAVSTNLARARLPADVPRDTAVGQSARAAALILGLTQGDGDLIRFGMEDLIAVPRRQGLIPGFDAAVSAGNAAGAYGVTISGAGSALLALAPRERAAAAAAAMAHALTTAGNTAIGITPAVAPTGLEVVNG
ncbi:MAG TPA: homoserine kinase [Gemmatimonadales bacterium]|nr:homoserine kinase [Gemmatimonadales bacterium]